MIQEKIHDALNLLDDDLIEAAAALRLKHQRHKKLRMCWTSLAACLCIAIISAAALQNSSKSIHKGLYSSNGGFSGSNHTSEPGNSIPGALDESDVFSVSVRIDQWQDDGFSGTVSDLLDCDVLESGDTIIVSFDENAYVTCPDGSMFAYDHENPNAPDCGIPAGSTVRVTFFTYENAETTDSEPDTAANLIIYADFIELAD